MNEYAKQKEMGFFIGIKRGHSDNPIRLTKEILAGSLAASVSFLFG